MFLKRELADVVRGYQSAFTVVDCGFGVVVQ
jgi:hypothetical protein